MPDIVTPTPLGHVMGIEGTTPFDWQVAIDDSQPVQLGDVVQVKVHVPGTQEPVRISGMVSNIAGLEEGATYASDVFLSAKGILPTKLARVAYVKTMRVNPEVWTPPMPGQPVFKAEGEARREALSFDTMDKLLPAGLTRDGEPFFVDYEFLCGVKGGHANISGISGVATKTSYASFLLYSLFNSGVLTKGEAANTRALIFNVKGEDLLYLDKNNKKMEATRRAAYTTLGLRPAAFASVDFRVPPRKGAGVGVVVPDTSGRTGGVEAYGWTLWELVKDNLLQFMFVDTHEGSGQISDLVARLEDRLVKTFKEDDSHPGGLQSKAAEGGKTIRISSLAELVEYIGKKLDDEDKAWTGGAVSATIGACMRRLRGAMLHLGHLILDRALADNKHRISLNKHVTVVDIHTLHERAQRFVVGVTLARLFREREDNAATESRTFIVLDELNKYAPRDGNSPIKDILLDIAERGRSLGVILIGAQQTASEVERRVSGNSAIRVVGRLDMAEITRPEYGFLDSTEKRRAGLLKPGTMLVSQPMLPVPVEVSFPFPAWATRRDEVAPEQGERVKDAFHGF